MVYYKTSDEVELIRQSCLLVCKALEQVAKSIKPGLKPEVIDKMAEELIRDHGAEPGFKGYRGFPATLCVSVNESVVHGIPGNRILEEGEILSVDVGVLKNNYYGDAAISIAVGSISEEKQKLMAVTEKSLYLGIDEAIQGNRIGDISHAVEDHVRSFGFSVVKELCGHGVGKYLHEEPQIPNYGRPGAGAQLKKGMTLAIEPMVNMGAFGVNVASDGWTVLTSDSLPSAHFEHTIAVTDGKPEILTVC